MLATVQGRVVITTEQVTIEWRRFRWTWVAFEVISNAISHNMDIAVADNFTGRISFKRFSDDAAHRATSTDCAPECVDWTGKALLLKPNSITLAGSKLVRSWSPTGMIWFEVHSRPTRGIAVCDQLRTS